MAKCNICGKDFSNFDAIGNYNGRDVHSDCFPQTVNPEWKAHRLLFPERDYSCMYILVPAMAIALLICFFN